MERLTGTCKFQSSGKKPYGFLADKNNVDHYWKSTNITASVKPIKTLKVGEAVEFESVEIDGKKQAVNVTAPGGGPVEGTDKLKKTVSRPRSRRRTVPTMMGGSAYNDALFGVP